MITSSPRMTRNPSAAEPPLDVAPAAGGTPVVGAVADVCAHAMPNVIMVYPLECEMSRTATEVPRDSPAYALRTSTSAMRVVIEGLGDDRALRTLVNGKVATSL